jgi:hypothetical protein
VCAKSPHVSNDAPPIGGASLVDSMAPVSSICKSCTSTMTFPMLPTIESVRSRKVRAGDGNSKKKRFKDDTSMKLTYLEVWAVHHLLAQQHLEMVRDCLHKNIEQSESEMDGVLVTSIQGASPVMGLLGCRHLSSLRTGSMQGKK